MKKWPKMEVTKIQRAENLKGEKTQKSSEIATGKSITIGNNNFKRQL